MNNSAKDAIKDVLREQMMQMMAGDNFNPNSMNSVPIQPTESSATQAEVENLVTQSAVLTEEAVDIGNESSFEFANRMASMMDRANTKGNTYEDSIEGFDSSENFDSDDDYTVIEDYPNDFEFTSPSNQTGSENTYSSQATQAMEDENRRLREENENLHRRVQSLSEFMNSSEQVAERAKVNDYVFNNVQPFEQVISEPCTSSFMGQPFQYRRYTENVDFGRRFERGLSNEDSAQSYLGLMNEVSLDIERNFGGWDRISDLAIINGLIVINSVSYEPKLPANYIENMPFDVRCALLDGRFAWLFDFSALRSMKNLVNLKFDDTDFVYNKVRKDLHLFSEFKPSVFFKVCKKLVNLQLGENYISASNSKQFDNIFHRASRCEEIYQSCLSFGWGVTKSRWNSIKDAYHDTNRSGLSKALGITLNTGAMVVSGASTAAVGLIGKVGKGFSNFTKSLKDNLK